MNYHKLHRVNTPEYWETPSLNKAPVEYSTEDDPVLERPLSPPNEKWNKISEVSLPNGLTYKQFQRNDAFAHQLYHPSSPNPVSEVRTRAVGNQDPLAPQEHMITWSLSSKNFKGRGLGRQAYLATLLHGKGITKLNSGNQLSRRGHSAWKKLSELPGLSTRLAPYATYGDYDIDPRSWDEAESKTHSIKVSNPDQLNMDLMFPSVDLEETKLAASEKLEKAEPRPTRVGEISPDGRKVGISIPGNVVVWDLHPKIKQGLDQETLLLAKDWLKTQPEEHHPILKQFINSVLKDPYRHVRYGSNVKNGPVMPRLRHVKEMVTNSPNSKLVVHSPESLSFYVGRHGEAGGISHFKHNLVKGLEKTENLFYNGLYGKYTDQSGNTYKFSNPDGNGMSKSERNALGAENGLFQQLGRLIKADDATVRSISELLRHSGMLGISGQRGDEESNGAPQGGGALLLTSSDMNKSELEKGAKGDWQKEGYAISIHKSKDHDYYDEGSEHDPSKHDFVVKVHDKEGNQVGEANIYNYPEVIESYDTRVINNHERKGIASAMYSYAEKVSGKKIRPAEAQADEGKKLWNQPNRPFGKSKLAKGAMRRLYPVERHPPKPEGVDEWIQGGGNRDSVPHEKDPNRRERMLQRLGKHTQVQILKNGKRKFLLHRGEGEKDSNVHQGIITHDDRSSWTPLFSVAAGHAKSQAEMDDEIPQHAHARRVNSAWIHEDNIASIPFHYGDLEGNKKRGKMADFGEHEVIVEPYHNSELHDQFDIDKDTDLKSLKPRSERMFGPSIHQRINARAFKKSEMDTKKYSLKYHPPKGSGPYGLHTVTAHDANGNIVGQLSAEDLNDGTFQANMVEVHPNHRRKGIASAMYRHMENKTKLKATPDLEAQTPEGASVWKQKNRAFGKSEDVFASLQKASASKKLLATLGLVAASVAPTGQMESKPAKQIITPQEAYRYPSAKKDIDLRTIAQVESRGGKDTKHDIITSGINAGTRAYGKYGLTHTTIKEVIDKTPSLREHKSVLNMDWKQVHDYMSKNPGLEDKVASSLYDNLSRAFNGNLNHISFAWLSGKQGTIDAIKEGKNINDHWHVQKINEAKNAILNPQEKNQNKKVKQKEQQLPFPKPGKIILP